MPVPSSQRAFPGELSLSLECAATAVALGTPYEGYYANAAMVRLVGCPNSDAFLSRPLLAWIAPEERDRAEAAWLEKKSSGAVQASLRTMSEELRVVRLAWVSVPGLRELYVFTLEDITALRATEEGLRVSESRTKALMDNLPFMAWLKDENGRFLSVNEPFARAAGRKVSEVLGQTDAALWPFELAAKYRADDLLVMKRRRQLRTEEVVHHPSGDIWHETLKTPIFDRHEEVIGTAGLAQDITDRKLAERERLEVLGQMQRLERLESLGILAGGIAHDFNNLLATLFGYIEQAKRATGDETVKVHLKQAMLAHERAKNLTAQLLTFSKGGVPIKQATEVAQLLRETIEFALSGSRVEADLSIDEALWFSECDHGQIGQVFHNIVQNAVQAMPGGGRLTVSARNVECAVGDPNGLVPGPYVEFLFRDEGKGIRAEVLEHIFDPFFTTKPGGTGLGLATSHSIVRRHQGSLTAESGVEKGAIFRLLLPAARNAGEVEARSSLPPLAHHGNGRALVLDDEPMLRELLSTLLEEMGYEVTAVATGRQALEAHETARAEGRPFSVALLDLTVPGGLGGREVIAELRPRDAGIAAIAASGYAGDPVLAEPVRHGFDGCLAKPFRFVELARELDRVVGIRHP